LQPWLIDLGPQKSDDLPIKWYISQFNSPTVYSSRGDSTELQDMSVEDDLLKDWVLSFFRKMMVQSLDFG
jgi:hypothetical protein